MTPTTGVDPPEGMGASVPDRATRPTDQAAPHLGDSASVPSAWPSFNINQTVAVKLTGEGLAVLRRNHDALNRASGFFAGHRPGILGDFRPPELDEDGWARFQLWDLMHEFGADIVMGRPVPFETTIRLDASAIEARSGGTAQTGPTEGESAVPERQTPKGDRR